MGASGTHLPKCHSTTDRKCRRLAASFWVASHFLRRRADDPPLRIVESAAILFTVLLAFMEIRHAVNAGNVYSDTASLIEVAVSAGEPKIPEAHLAKLVTLGYVALTTKGAIVTGDGLIRITESE